MSCTHIPIDHLELHRLCRCMCPLETIMNVTFVFGVCEQLTHHHVVFLVKIFARHYLYVVLVLYWKLYILLAISQIPEFQDRTELLYCFTIFRYFFGPYYSSRGKCFWIVRRLLNFVLSNLIELMKLFVRTAKHQKSIYNKECWELILLKLIKNERTRTRIYIKNFLKKTKIHLFIYTIHTQTTLLALIQAGKKNKKTKKLYIHLLLKFR